MVSRDRRPVLAAAGAAALVTLALEVRTLMPDVGFWDTAEFQAIGPVLGIAHPTGYPSYTLLAWLASVVLQPFGNEAFRANLLSALLVAAAVAFLVVSVWLLTRRALLGLAAGLVLAAGPTVWRIGLRADAHALHLALVVFLLVLLLVWAARERQGVARSGRWLVAASVVFAIALGNHALTLLLAPGIALFVLLVDPWIPIRRWRLVLSCGVALVATTVALYLYLPLRSAMDPPLDYANPETWEAFRYLVLGEQFRGTFTPLPSVAEGVRIVWDALRANLGLVALLAPVGLVALAVRQPRVAVLTGAWFLLTWVFALGYVNADIGRYHLVPILLAVLWAAVAVDTAVGIVLSLVAGRSDGAAPRGGRADDASGRAGAPALVATVVAALLLVLPAVVAIPERMETVDASSEMDGRQWMEATLDALEPDAVVVSWWSFSTNLWYGRHVEGRRPDVTIIDDRTILDQGLGNVPSVVERYVDERPVYVIRMPHDLEEVGRRFRLEPVPGIPPLTTVYRVAERLGGV